MGDAVLARTPWGEIAYALAGKAGYERVQQSDQLVSAPGADTIRELFGGEPTLILLDELSVYLRKVHNMPNARDQLTAFLTSLFKAIESTPNAALVYTLAIGKDGKASDAYSDENQFIADRMAEAESVSARKATLLNPTEDDETIQVLRRRLFDKIDHNKAAIVIEGYRAQWAANKESLPAYAGYPETVDRAKYNAANKEKWRAWNLNLRYGITVEQWNAMFAAQGNCCAICASVKPGSKYGWHTDHCHDTKKVRGILCHQCNIMIGCARDNSATLVAAISYLRKE